LQAKYRLKDNREFRRVFQRGRSVATGRMVLYWYENRSTAEFRVGISISKKVGKAVVRNKLKRRLRECFQLLAPELKDKHVDIVVVCRKSAADMTFADIHSELLKLLRKAKIMV
jgi:ribonuclease P protein component